MYSKIILKYLMTTYLLFLIISNVFGDPTDSSEEGSPSVGGDNRGFLQKGLSFITSNGTVLNCLGIPSGLFSNIIEKLFTQATMAEDVQFYLYSRDYAGNTIIRAGEDFNLEDINFRFDRRTVFIIHGFLASGKEFWVQDMKDAFLEMEDLNVIVVDWQRGSNTWNYIAASISTRIVGAQIALFLRRLQEKALEISPDLFEEGSLYFVGHSLGAHISAHAAHVIDMNTIDKNRRWIVRRITGLDPAQPCFSEADPALKLDKDDADYVDIIHTNGRSMLLLGLGIPNKIGHMDFYPNGGQIQIGCDKIDVSFWITTVNLPAPLIQRTICSHGRSHDLFTDTIRMRTSKKCTYVGHPWNQKYENVEELLESTCNEGVCPEMGINSIGYYPSKDRAFFVPTSESEHYCDVSKADREKIARRLRRDNSIIKTTFLKVVGSVFG